MTIKINGIELTDGEVTNIIQAAVEVVIEDVVIEDGEPNNLEAVMAKEIHKAGLIDEETRNRYMGYY